MLKDPTRHSSTKTDKDYTAERQRILKYDNYGMYSIEMPGPNIDKWEKVLNKGVRTKEGDTIGVVQGEEGEFIFVSTSGQTNMYRLPKDKVEEFNGAEIKLSMTLEELTPYKESPK